jgi:hypothetical protein
MGGDRVPDEPEVRAHRRAQAVCASIAQEFQQVDCQVGHDRWIDRGSGYCVGDPRQVSPCGFRSVRLCFAKEAERVVEAALGCHDMSPRHDCGEGERAGHREQVPATARMSGKARKHLMGFGKRRGGDQHVANAHSSAGQIT